MTTHTAHTIRDSRGYAFTFLLVAGFTFWFILGFPFQHHNESYIWVAHLENGDFLDCVLHKMVPVANYRPLGQAVIWLTFRLSGGSVAPAQVFNFVVAIAAWLLAFAVIKERRTFGFAALLTGSLFFSAYIYIFHLHGAFYSPVLLFLVLLFVVFEQENGRRHVGLATAGALIAAFFHPYALLLFIAAVIGAWWKQRHSLSRTELLSLFVAAFVAAAAIVLLVILPGNTEPGTLAKRWTGLVISYRATEVHPAISAAVAVLTLLTALNAGPRRTTRILLTGGAAAGLIALQLLGLPLFFVWIAVSAAKLLLLNHVSLAATLLTASILPTIAPTGSPTYAIFAGMLCTMALSVDAHVYEHFLAHIGMRTGITAFVAIVAMAFVLRSGVRVPILTGLATPVLAERERTEQLVTILDWWQNSQFSPLPVTLAQEAYNPVDAVDVSDRRSRPPTNSQYLYQYTAHRWNRGRPGETDSSRLVVVFGDASRSTGDPVYTLTSRFATPARVLVESK